MFLLVVLLWVFSPGIECSCSSTFLYYWKKKMEMQARRWQVMDQWLTEDTQYYLWHYIQCRLHEWQKNLKVLHLSPAACTFHYTRLSKVSKGYKRNRISFIRASLGKHNYSCRQEESSSLIWLQVVSHCTWSVIRYLSLGTETSWILTCMVSQEWKNAQVLHCYTGCRTLELWLCVSCYNNYFWKSRNGLFNKLQ